MNEGKTWPQRQFKVTLSVKVCDEHVASAQADDMKWRIERAIASALEEDDGPPGVTWCAVCVVDMAEIADVPPTTHPESSK